MAEAVSSLPEDSPSSSTAYRQPSPRPNERTPLLATGPPGPPPARPHVVHVGPKLPRAAFQQRSASHPSRLGAPGSPSTSALQRVNTPVPYPKGSWEAPPAVVLMTTRPAPLGRTPSDLASSRLWPAATSCAPAPPLPFSPRKRGQLLLRHSFGYLCIAGTVVTWVLQNELLQCLQTASCLRGSRRFNKPFTMTWWNHSCLALLLPLDRLLARIAPAASPPSCPSSTLPADLVKAGLTPCRLLWLTLPLATMYLVADYFWFLALPYTTVCVATAIMNSNCAFVFLLSVFLFNERVSYMKAQALLVAMGGIMVIASMAPHMHFNPVHERGSIQETMYGDVNAAIAALFYALYEVFFAKYICFGLRLSSARAISTISGYIGLSTLLFLWPGILLFHFLSQDYVLYHEHLRWPRWEETLAMAIGGTFTLVFNVMILLSVAFTSPLKTNVGCMLMIPLAALIDWAFRGVVLATANIFGGALIVGGFVLLVLED